MLKALRRILIACVVLYVLACAAIYFFQETLLFHPTQLSKDHVFRFDVPFEEKFIRTKDGANLHGLLFHADSSKGVILYLHGNGGALDTWGSVAGAYTSSHYDVFMLDYPGYGKSEGSIAGEEQLVDGVQVAYDSLKTHYAEPDIIVLGYSIGSGLAAKVASVNHPGMLILQAPYFSMKDLARREFPWAPSFVLRYPLMTNEHLRSCAMPVVVFHGDQDRVIPYQDAVELSKSFKSGDTLITLHGWGHNGFTDSPEYLDAIRRILH
jgi:uncharacterized protein